MLDGGGLQFKQFFRGLHRLGHGREEQKANAALFRQRDDLQLRRNDGRERAFAAGEDGEQVAGVLCRPGQRIARPAFQQSRRETFRDRQRVERDQVFDQQPLPLQHVMAGADLHHAPVAQHDLQFAHVHSRRAIDRRVRTRRIVGDHAAQCRARTRRHVRPETEVCGMQKAVQLVQHHARPHADGLAFLVERVDVPVVPREIDHQPVADGAAGKPRARAARNHRDAGLRRRLDDGAGLRRILGKRHRQRHDLIRRSIRGVKLACQVVHGHLAVRGLECGQLLGGHHLDVTNLSA